MNLHQRPQKAHKEDEMERLGNEERGRNKKMINSKKVRRKMKTVSEGIKNSIFF